MIITIDGPAGTGKSTVAKRVAKSLSFHYFDTGAMYRSFCSFLLDNEVDIDNESQVKHALSEFSFNIVDGDKEKIYLVNGKDVTKQIRTSLVTSIVSKIAALGFVREKLVKIQREFGELKNAVFEGRDMGTVVFPDANLKIFLTADPYIRAERRYNEYLLRFPEKRNEISLEDILEDIQKRDHYDSTRKISPLKEARNAFIIDTSNMTIDEVVKKILILKKSSKSKKGNFLYYIVRGLAKAFFKTFFRFKVYGVENVPKNSAIVASNHVSFLDPPVIAVSCPCEINFLARESLFKGLFFKWLIKKLNAHPISPKVSGRRTLKITLDLLSNEQKILIFPEGRRSKTDDISQIKSGIGFLAWKSKAPIVPTFISGTFKAWPRSKKFPRLFRKITCTFGKPIYIHEFEHLDRDVAIKEITNKTYSALTSLKELHYRQKTQN